MGDGAWSAELFEEHRARLRAVAYRMLGSVSEADDAVQETWLRADRAGADGVENVAGWLTTIVGRVCLNLLRTRERQREEPFDARPADPVTGPRDGGAPEEEAVLADSVGVALLVVLDRLSPAERLAFVLHDLFAVPFDEIGPLLDRSTAAVRQLASRARRRVKGDGPLPEGDPARRRHAVEAFLAATRGGDFDALVGLLHPDVVLHADRFVVPTPEPVTVQGAATVARGAMAATGRALFTGLALLDGSVGLVMAPRGRLALVLVFTFADDGRISAIQVVADRERLAALGIAPLDDRPER
ncbi:MULTISPECIES: sigma-70 family RNA polymerase sigma factor [unclassified Streptomyces]|uniref:sigma-70 family RNA polymerase sigma factor n=1 Tax=unclassified Streptomyces TaxID=2593676 RepID=UPI002E2E62CE|nr:MULTISPECIES: sigma-70 family RNA polymerase sigma factor [unclassified Streptomyces]WUB88839.1 sigma-70 family RNA polymerase sigma factor [Streptomyces sp. NBC_00566]